METAICERRRRGPERGLARLKFLMLATNGKMRRYNEYTWPQHQQLAMMELRARLRNPADKTVLRDVRAIRELGFMQEA